MIYSFASIIEPRRQLVGKQARDVLCVPGDLPDAESLPDKSAPVAWLIAVLDLVPPVMAFADNLRDLYAESGHTLQGLFSAVAKPKFASKYSLECSRRDLHNALLCTVLKAHIFVKK